MKLGLIGKSLTHSFSYRYFAEKFRNESLTHYHYQNYELASIDEFPKLLKEQPALVGLNVTVPYKNAVIPYLDKLDPVAEKIGAVNTIRIHENRTYGFNTDHLGFSHSLTPLLSEGLHRAMILGTGGSARAVCYALEQLNIEYINVSRQGGETNLSYRQAGEQLTEYDLLINCTPLGTYPKVEEMPPLALDNVSENHLFYDLVYNPEKTRLLKEAEARGARVKNGYEMLELQAEAAWKIWHEI